MGEGGSAMSDIQGIRDDLAYMRGLADDGRQPSRRGGVILATGGFTFAAASVAAWGCLSGRLPGGAQSVWAPWTAATLVFYAVLFVQQRALKREGRCATPAPSGLSGLAWAAVGGAMFSLILAAAAASWAMRSERVWALIPSVFTALYGAGWTVAAAASGRDWMRNLALASFAGAVAIAFTANSTAVWLAYAAALALLGGAPGLVLARDPRGA